MNGDSAAWTIDRLARLAAAALAAGAPTQPNGRIREVPDVRTIRWYTSIGLLGRPAAMRGRTALYGRSHLAQLVAIKRLQASGLTVAAVQERLLGAQESAVEEIAMLPADLDALIAQVEADEPGAASPTAGAPAARTRFWADASLPADTASAGETSSTGAASTGDTSSTDAASTGDTSSTDAASTGDTSSTGAASTGDTSSTAGVPSASTADADRAPAVHGLRLAPDVTLLLPPGRVPDAAARAAIAEAARPLLDLLDRLGLSGS